MLYRVYSYLTLVLLINTELSGSSCNKRDSILSTSDIHILRMYSTSVKYVLLLIIKVKRSGSVCCPACFVILHDKKTTAATLRCQVSLSQVTLK